MVDAQGVSLRVLAVIPGDGQGSSFIFARRQVESLLRLGVNVRVFYLKSRTSPSGVLKELRRLRREIREFGPHLLHAHYGTVTSFLSGYGTDIPLVITFRGSDVNGHPALGFLRGYIGFVLSQLSTLRAKRVVCVSQRIRDRLWWRRNRTVILPTGVNLSLFRPCPRDAARAQLGWKTADHVVLFSSGSEPHAKGIELARATVGIAESAVGAVRLAILDGTVVPDEVPVYLNASDCLVLASCREGSPNIVKEALACNLPVVAVDVGDVAERLRDVYPSQVTERNAAALGRAVADILRLGLRSNGRSKVAAYSEEMVANQILSTYLDVIRTSTGHMTIKQCIETPCPKENSR